MTRRRRGALAAGLGSLALGLAGSGCSAAQDPLLVVEFGSDHAGSSVAASLPTAGYRFDLDCSGADRIRIRLQAGSVTVHTADLPCAAGASEEFRLDRPAPGEAMLLVEESPASGKLQLFRR